MVGCYTFKAHRAGLYDMKIEKIQKGAGAGKWDESLLPRRDNDRASKHDVNMQIGLRLLRLVLSGLERFSRERSLACTLNMPDICLCGRAFAVLSLRTFSFMTELSHESPKWFAQPTVVTPTDKVAPMNVWCDTRVSDIRSVMRVPA